MALVFCDGFERVGLGKKWADPGYDGTSTNRARTGSRSASYAFSAGTWTPNASGSTFIFGVAVWMSSGGTFYIGCDKDSVAGGGNGQIGVQIQSNGSFTAYRAGQPGYGQQVGTASAPNLYRWDQWNYIEGKIVIDNSTGSVTVKCNGETVLTLTNQDTQGRSTADWNSIRLQLGSNGSCDDLVVADGSGAQNNDWLGQCRVVTILPVTDAVDAGSHADFTCSGGTDHGALVDEESSDGDTTYVYSSTVGHIDSWNFAALGYTGTIKGVQLDVAAKKTESGTRAIQLLTRPTSTDRIDTTDRYLGETNYDRHLKLWELNPDDSAAWEVADVDGAEFGVKVSV